MDISWEDAQTFLAVAEARSFSGAARALGVGQPTISRRIAEFEERLGCQLFRRGKRGAQLTDQGAQLVPAAEQMARWAGEFDRQARGTEAEPEGCVRVASPPALAVDFLGPLAFVVKERLPAIRLEVLASIDHVDLSRGIADLAIRTRPPHEPELTSVGHLTVPVGVFASPAYAATLDPPARLRDLDWITWAFPYEHVAPRPMLEREIPDFEPAFASDNYLVQRSALHAGLGAMILEKPIHPNGLRPANERPALVEVDVGVELPAGELHIVCARSMQFVPRVRAVIDLLRLTFLDEASVNSR
jgi:DNA-binding transcriptional LysR family regulator